MMQKIEFSMFLQPTGLMMDEEKKGHKVDLETDGASAFPDDDHDDHGHDEDDHDDYDDCYYDDDGAGNRQNQVEVNCERSVVDYDHDYGSDMMMDDKVGDEDDDDHVVIDDEDEYDKDDDRFGKERK